jgi:hypothetical protein
VDNQILQDSPWAKLSPSIGMLFANTDGSLLSDRRVFINRKPGLRLGSVLGEMKEDAELL